MTIYAISVIGWGRGETAEEAETNYYEVVAQDYKHIHRTRPGRIKIIREKAQPTILEAPEGATGFFLDGRTVNWTFPPHQNYSSRTDVVAPL